jgi:hypothetical protein
VGNGGGVLLLLHGGGSGRISGRGKEIKMNQENENENDIHGSRVKGGLASSDT